MIVAIGSLGRLVALMGPPWGLLTALRWFLLGESAFTLLIAAKQALPYVLKSARCWRIPPTPPEAPHWSPKSWGISAERGLLVLTFRAEDSCYTYQYDYDFKWVVLALALWSLALYLWLAYWANRPQWRIRALRPVWKRCRQIGMFLRRTMPIYPKWEKGDLCGICLNEIISPKAKPQNDNEAVVYCKYGCGKVVHATCMRMWMEHRSCCIYCQKEWTE
uniref:RING-type domain-containing protein n=1 Tax=Pinguiococcus pyrenoidosus TaxID=172671 RepID=A0A7R9U381_9STRA|mmetsp:Transcript_13095/g.48607  ORF Transcript_13095/g.48607 Transcript_13095/m.48607 type:complete len:219 (+) Transcript_13095:83-739(+)